jgi:DivIVA domain-containing protein
VTQQDERVSQDPLSADDIRGQEFSHRMRGLDEYEVREFLDVLADQVRADEAERADDRAEIERLRAEVEQLRSRAPATDPDEVTRQAVALFSQAQQVADQLVEEAVRHARDLMTSARNQQREILQRAHDAADSAVRVTGAMRPDGTMEGYTTPVPEIEYVRTFAHVAQIQLRSVLDALTEQVERLGEVPKLNPGESVRAELDASRPSPPFPSPRQSEQVFVYPGPQPRGS